MKFTSCLLLLATLSLCLASQVKYNKYNTNNYKDDKHVYVVLADSEVKHNNLVLSLLNFGSAQVLSGACSSQQLFGAADFKLGQIHEVSRWSDKSRALYKFTVRHNHATRSELYIESRFTVQYLLTGASSAQRSSIIFSDYNIKFDECATLQGAYKVLPSSQHRNTLIQQLLGHGNGYVCGEARHRNQLARLPASIANLDVLVINKIAVRSLSDITYYRYDVVLGDGGHRNWNYRVDATFIVMLCKKTGKYSVVSVEYTIRDLLNNKECGQSDYKSDSDCSDDSSDSCDYSDSDCSDKKRRSSYKNEGSDSDSDCSDKKRRSNYKNEGSDSDSDCSDNKHRSNSKNEGSNSDCSDKHSDKRSQRYNNKRNF